MRAAHAAAGLTVGLLVAFACVHVPAVGESCKPQEGHCLDGQTALTCQGGVAAAFSCPGPKGCTVGQARAVACDQSSGAAPGSACFPEYEGRGQCAQEAGAIMQCTRGTWVKLACPQGQACRDSGGEVHCE